MTLEQAILKAMKELPEGWDIELLIQRGGVWVKLIGPNEHVMGYEYRTTAHLFTAINRAVAKAQKET